jgi:hypothetical protein
MAYAHISDLTFRHMNARQQAPRIGDAADFSAFREILPDQARQFVAEDGAGAGRNEFKLGQSASQQIAADFQRGNEGASLAQFDVQFPGM